MKSVDWMPFEGDRFWESDSVALMDDSGVALYVWLLWRQFKQESLPGPEVLCKLPHRWQGKRWEKAWRQVAACFEEGPDGRLRNAVCEQHRMSMLERVETAREKSLKGVEARAKKRGQHQPQVDPGSTLGATQGQPLTGTDLNGTEQTGTERGKTARARGDRPAKPATVEVEWWPPTFAEFHDAGLDTPEALAAFGRLIRTRKKRRDSAWDADRLRGKLREFAPFGAAAWVQAVDETIGNGWQGTFTPKTAKNGVPGQPTGMAAVASMMRGAP